MGNVIIELLALIGIVALVIWLQCWLSSRKSPLPGLSIIALTAMLFIGLTIWSFYTAAGYHDILLTKDLNNGQKGEITIRLDREDEVVAMTSLIIRDKTGKKLGEIGWGDRYRYTEIQKEMTEGYDVDEKTPWLSLRTDIKNGVQVGNTTFSRELFLVGLLFVDLPLLAIYLTKRKQMRGQNRREEMKKIKVESL